MKQFISRIKTKIEQSLWQNYSRVYLDNCNQELLANFNYETGDKLDYSCKYVCDLVAIPVQDKRFDYIGFIFTIICYFIPSRS